MGKAKQRRLQVLTPAEKHQDGHLSLGPQNMTPPHTLPRVCYHLDLALLSATYPTLGGRSELHVGADDKGQNNIYCELETSHILVFISWG